MGNRFDDLFKEADEAFDGKYSEELKRLNALSKKQLDSLSPKTTETEAYNALIKVVAEASRENLSQAQLAENIRKLGKTAVSIASKVTSLATIL